MLYLHWQPYNCNHNFEFPLVLIGSVRKSYIAYRKSVLFICECLILKQIPSVSAWSKFAKPNQVCVQPFVQKSWSYMPTLPDYPGVSRIRQQSPGLPYGSPNLPDKIELWAFLRFNLEFIPFSPNIFSQNLNFIWFKVRFLGYFRTYFITDKD